MSFESFQYRTVKTSFAYSLKKLFSASEIQLIWRESLVHFMGISIVEQMTSDDKILSAQQVEQLNKILERLIKGEPFQYIIGEVEFYGLNIKIDHRALIPRPETEELTNWIAGNHDDELKHIVDFCSGSGCIALALANKFQHASTIGLDASVEAIALSEENALALKLPTEFIQMDVLDETSLDHFLKLKTQTNGLLDVAVCNPPYIPNKEKAEMNSVVLDYEPEMALFVPDHDPLLFYKSISKSVYPYLSTDGSLYFECHYLNVDKTREMLLQSGYHNVEKRKDLQGKWRMLKAQKL